MGYKSLLFCPDERTARVVTQVLNELEFSVEPANEPYGAVKKLSDERFDALVVDCQNEQDASLLFKTARDSSQNHSTLSVAVVEGQAGVAKAFRIGANLILTKPINVEQSKGTLRVARGLLRKNELKSGTASTQTPARISQQIPTAPPAPSRLASPIAAPSTTSRSAGEEVIAPNRPFSSIEAEPERTPEPEAADVAVLASLPELAGNATSHSSTASATTEAEPIAAGTSGQAAAAAPALEKTESAGWKAANLPPMVTNEPIVDSRFSEPFIQPEPDPPTFATNITDRESSGGMKFLKIAAILLVVGVSGYFGWQKLHPLEYFQPLLAKHSTTASQPAEPSAATAVSPVASALPASPQEPSAGAQPEIEISASPSRPPAASDDSEDDIEVQELPMSRDGKVSSATNARPLVVTPDTGTTKTPTRSQIAPPSAPASPFDASGPALPSLAEATPALPKLAPSSLRVSQGVSQGLLLKKVPPVYPAMALQMHQEGAVELLATIGKQGTITNVKILSGDAMFAKPAADAVKQWKYRPYLLNGEPVEIQTQITIRFTSPQ
jgi:TonB family protein